MANEVRSKMVLDAQQSIRALGGVNKKIEAYNAEVRKSVTLQRQLNRTSTTAVDRVKALNRVVSSGTRSLKNHKDAVQADSRAMRAHTKTVQTTSAAVRELRTAVRQLTRQMTSDQGRQKAAVDSTSAAYDRQVQAAQRAAAAARRTLTGGGGFGTSGRAARFSGIATTPTPESIRLTGEHARQLQAINAAHARAEQTTNGLAKASGRKNQVIDKQSKLWARDTRAMGQANLQAIGLFFSFRNLIRIVAGLTFFRGIILFTSAMTDAVKRAKDFERAIGEIQTISDRAAVTTQQWREQLTDVSNAFGVGSVESAEAAYQALSNQVVNATQVQSFLTDEVKLSITALSTLDQAVQATTAVLNAFQENADAASRVNAILFKTVELGRIRLSELSNTIGRVSILSNQLGISFVEQQAALTLLTRQGIRAEEAITLLRNVELKLVKPTEAMSEKLREFGFASGEAAVAALGLPGVVQLFANEANKSGDAAAELAQIYGRLRAIVGGLGLTQGDLNKEVEKFAGAPQKAFDEFIERLDDLDVRANKQLERLKDAMRDTFGKRILEGLVNFSEGLGGADVALVKLTQAIQKGITIWISYRIATSLAGASTTAFTFRMRTAGAAMLTTANFGRGLIIVLRSLISVQSIYTLGLTALVSLLIDAQFAAQQFALRMEVAGTAARQSGLETATIAFERAKVAIDESSIALEQNISVITRSYRQFSANLQADNNAILLSVEDTFDRAKDAIKESLEDPLKTIREELRGLRGEIEETLADAEARTKRIAKERRAAEVDAARDVIDREPDEEARVRRLAELREDLNRRAIEAINAGETEAFEDFKSAVDRVGEEIETSIRKIRDEAARPIKTRIETIVPKVDINTGKVSFRKSSTSTESTKDADLAKRAAEALITAETRRKEIVDSRIAAEEAFITREEARAKAEEAKLAKREAAFARFTDLLAKVDAFEIDDALDPKAIVNFDSIVRDADAAAREAGLNDLERLKFLREANAAQIQLRLKAEKEAENERLNLVNESIDKIKNRELDLLKTRDSALKASAKAITDDFIPALNEELGKLIELNKAVESFGASTVSSLVKDKGGITTSVKELTDGERALKELVPLLNTVQGTFDTIARTEGLETQLIHAEGLDFRLEQINLKLKELREGTLIVSGNPFVGDTGTGADFTVGEETLDEIIKKIEAQRDKIAEATAEFNRANQAAATLSKELAIAEQELAKLPEGANILRQAIANLGRQPIENTQQFIAELGKVNEQLKEVERLHRESADSAKGRAADAEREAAALERAKAALDAAEKKAKAPAPKDPFGLAGIPARGAIGNTLQSRRQAAEVRAQIAADNIDRLQEEAFLRGPGADTKELDARIEREKKIKAEREAELKAVDAEIAKRKEQFNPEDIDKFVKGRERLREIEQKDERARAAAQAAQNRLDKLSKDPDVNPDLVAGAGRAVTRRQQEAEIARRRAIEGRRQLAAFEEQIPQGVELPAEKTPQQQARERRQLEQDRRRFLALANKGNEGRLTVETATELLALDTRLKAEKEAGNEQLEKTVLLQQAVADALQKQIEAQEKLNEARGGGGQAQAKHFGGNVLSRVFGGRGSDQIPALIGSDEVVVKGSAARAFSPLLAALNNIDSTGNGSVVSNTVNFGDVSVQVPQGTTSEQADAVIAEVQRRARLGLASF